MAAPVQRKAMEKGRQFGATNELSLAIRASGRAREVLHPPGLDCQLVRPAGQLALEVESGAGRQTQGLDRANLRS